ncbi:MAG: hypothetical protein BGO43_01620 [Gammaproteobacteria bacterium 39-13]|nr:hypothetical protein [Gammaproteobacteria bacterium]OJV94228.1 MAG: hypothetical protein BGO43_01620 [Gammaproteobacteria bacterium 39-13]
MNNTIIYLIGFAGTGKLTIAKEIIAKTNMKLVSNHLINNPVLSLIHADGKTPLPAEVWQNIAKIRDVVFDAVAHLSPAEYSFIFTNELIEGNEIDLKIYRKIESIAAQRGSKFLPIRLICEVDELCKRVVSEERKINHKMIDADAARQQFIKTKVLTPDHSNTFTLDVTHITAKQAADVILKRLIENK